MIAGVTPHLTEQEYERAIEIMAALFVHGVLSLRQPPRTIDFAFVRVLSAR